MRIAHVITRFVPGGAQQVVQSLVSGLSKRGYQAALLCGMQDLLEPKRLDELRQQGVEVFLLEDLVRPVSLVHDPKVISQLAQIFRKFNPDIVHTHTSKAGVVGRWAARRAKVPVIVHTPHGLIYKPQSEIEDVPRNPLLLKGLQCVEKFMNHLTDTITTLTELERQEMIQLGMAKPDQIVTIPNGLDTVTYRVSQTREVLAKKYGVPAGRPIVGSVGRLSAVKGHVWFVRAALLLLEAGYPYHFVIVGDGPERPRLERMVQEAGHAQSIQFLGYQRQIAEILTTLDLFVLPSLYEGFGISILEAFAVGVPVLANRVGGVSEIILNGENGVLVEPRDDGQLARSIVSLIEQKELLQKLVQNGKKTLEERFTLERMVNRFDELYRFLLQVCAERRTK